MSSEKFKDKAFKVCGTPEFLVRQAEAMDILTGNSEWTEDERNDALKYFNGEVSSDEVVKKQLKKVGVNCEV